jgi:hypothetical protein
MSYAAAQMSSEDRMSSIDPNDELAILVGIKVLAATGRYRLSVHVVKRMALHGVILKELQEALAGAQLLENYPTYHHGPCCLIYGETAPGRPLHLVCSTTLPDLVIITV